MSSNKNSINYPKVTIGIPVYNGEQFIHKAIDSLLAQTFTDFELIISDNASSDSTSAICQKYLKKDKRIRYFRQEKNMGPLYNFLFLLQQAKSQYFMWAAADDFWSPCFVEKNISILESSKNIVGSISDVEFYGCVPDSLKSNANGSTYRNLIKNQQSSASHEEKLGFYLRFNRGIHIYSIFRTDILQKSIIHQIHSGWDQTVILNVLKHGDLHIIDEVLMFRSAQGLTSTGSIIRRLRKQKVALPWIIFQFVPFTFYAAKHLGLRIFMKNIMWFIRLNYRGERSILSALIRTCKRKICRQEDF
jgi:glycosyltransferase involved in cell wall biosynthesis